LAYFLWCNPFPLKSNHLFLSPIVSSTLIGAFYFSFERIFFFFPIALTLLITPKLLHSILFPTPTLLILHLSSLSHFHSTPLSLSLKHTHTHHELFLYTARSFLLNSEMGSSSSVHRNQQPNMKHLTLPLESKAENLVIPSSPFKEKPKNGNFVTDDAAFKSQWSPSRSTTTFSVTDCGDDGRVPLGFFLPSNLSIFVHHHKKLYFLFSSFIMIIMV